MHNIWYNVNTMKPVFLSNFFQQNRALDLLLEESTSNSSFYLFLGTSAFLTTLGLMLNSAVMIIGGMLVAPLLFPILLLGMGVTTSSRTVIKKAFNVIGKSILAVVSVAFITSFILNASEVTEQMIISSNPDLLFFLAAFASGIIAAYAWAKEDIASRLPGIAVAVSLVPPLASVGVAISVGSRDIFTGALTLFIINLLGISVASMLVFSLFGYARLQRVAEESIHAQNELVEKERRTKNPNSKSE